MRVSFQLTAPPSGAPAVSSFGGIQALRRDLYRVRLPLVNVFLLGEPGGPWVLVDAGMPGTAELILRAAREIHGARPPAAIVMTHGHFDHVGALHDLLRHWPVPVYAHELELPYLTGEAAYPFPDPTVGGAMSLLSPAFLPGPYDFRPQVRRLPEGRLPHVHGWQWLHTPGHTPGHVSLWRDSDRTLVVGDAFVTTPQQTVRGALLNDPMQVQGPPPYYTPNWEEARASVQNLAGLQPELAATGHGHPMSGERLRRELDALARTFDAEARPQRGWYLSHPVPTERRGAGDPDPMRTLFLGGLGAAAAAWLWLRR
ncbi:beta-lactamase domain protein [Deinococcus proteolyticus MRP]|uniref:Beta-lactamase domain protein n=1 Tax=Deinococcus proteolyticus (strain ATCC 35074 / DSM 20540 / JCM 6276 / NBRC 101906 / NCIMB 13154 / VKM Ac-1939 / CCM 2703 / MRP) TaxID=693977 RepID=F0RJN1_DEIPM|nr:MULTISPECIES: MBL fold metallo-hydrolase [Deinococcus]ADY26601.1 beta-lactamase domain protein [Deinococcus proteolyticus MRP]MCY1702726.1 MBL fold metallo-hydrolase [Deinococcus sp. SL84]